MPVLAAADLAATLPENCPFQVTRSWTVENGKLVLKFDVKNKLGVPVEIGSLGIPLILNNNAGYDGDKGKVQNLAAFSDPAIGLDGGYVQAIRMNGQGPTLLIVPEGNTPLEAYEPMQGDVVREASQPSQTMEGFYEWMVHSAAYASNEWRTINDRWVQSHGVSEAYAETDWKELHPWNTPTSETLAPGATRTYGLKFLLASDIRDITKTLVANDRPAALGVPGYILPMEMDGKLFLKYSKEVKSIASVPPGAIEVKKGESAKDGWVQYIVNGKTWGRCDMRIEYTDELGSDHQLRCHQARGQGAGGHGAILVYQRLVHGYQRSFPSRSFRNDL